MLRSPPTGSAGQGPDRVGDRMKLNRAELTFLAIGFTLAALMVCALIGAGIGGR